MKKSKKIILAGVAAFTLAITSVTAFAFTTGSPAEIFAGLTEKTVDEAIDLRYESGKTFGQLASDEGVWEEFNTEMLEGKKSLLDERVANGYLTQEEADEIYSGILERTEYCDGYGIGGGRMGCNYGNGFGQGRGYGRIR
ncbi:MULTISPECIES: hypothetical protein [unclassified Sedimentibacter]|uniref:hypothetical protein n=1 Tax=unclassified Sedimentibacter TaxID=2649220 RepID=UPI0027E10F34|nr:hypothetical protein [Sedimentibacter sp. MB35-C1]WMJ78830.1 hypothetical protein RBQ61_07850 [Sedimentibacter sp. MB35-C1]